VRLSVDNQRPSTGGRIQDLLDSFERPRPRPARLETNDVKREDLGAESGVDRDAA
jgi:hypothetical protein